MKLTKLELLTIGNAVQQVGNIKFPVQSKTKLVSFIARLNNVIKPVDKERQVIYKKYMNKFDDKGVKVRLTDQEQENMQIEIDTFLEGEIEFDFKEKITLPKMISSTCDKCHHNMDKPLEIESNILAILEPFIEV
jgi:hypothetical protein